MSILPIFAARVVIRKLIRAGFRYIGARGSHQFYRHIVTKRTTSIPVHGGNTIGRGLLKKIIEQAGISLKEFLDL